MDSVVVPARAVRPAPEEADADIPTVGRPADLPFSDASGDFRVWADAAPKTLEAQKPLTLTLHVEARSAFRRPPRRIDLRELPSFRDRFTFEEIDDGDGRPSGPQSWAFVYRLHPKSGVTAVPGIPFVFYNPEIQYPRKGFQVAYTDPIALTVKPPEVYVFPLSGPEALFSCAGGPAVTATEGRWAPPGPWSVAALTSAPPLLCLFWYLGWRRLYPDAALRARRRRSLAARCALQALHGAGRLPSIQQAARIAAVAADYLRGRFDAPAEEPTPAEAAACLRRAGCSSALAEQAAALFRDCDAARFAPLTPTPLPSGERGRGEGVPDLPAAAVRFILAVEAETWSTPRS